MSQGLHGSAGGGYDDGYRDGRSAGYREGYEAGRAARVDVDVGAKAVRTAVEEARQLMKRLAEVVSGAARLGAGESAPLLVNAREAARLLGITTAALRKRVHPGQVARGAIKFTGRRVQFVRARLVG
jgi:flagellar biosynthesis/type III secretory pathway protein FliH